MPRKHTKQFSQEEIMKRKERLEGARDKRSLETKKNDQILLEHIYRYPGKTSSDIQKDFSDDSSLKDIFVRSYLINALKRLEKQNQITFKTEEKQGKILKKYFYRHLKDKQNKIIITKTELEKIFNENIENWIKIVQVAAIDEHTIVITTEKNKKIIEESIYHEKPLVKFLNQNEVEITLPQKFEDFYKLQKDAPFFNWSISSNSIELRLKTTPEDSKNITKKIKDVLILEDDDDQRDILSEDLKENGYNVIPCKSDNDILQGIEKWKNVDYFISDDDIFGHKIARAVFFMLQKKFPKLRAGLISGRSRTDREEQGLLDAGFTYIFQKGKPKNRHHGVNQISDELIEHLGSLNYA